MKNLEIRNTLATHGIRHWELADAIGISPYSLTIWLRHDLTGDRLSRVSYALATLLASLQQAEGGEH